MRYLPPCFRGSCVVTYWGHNILEYCDVMELSLSRWTAAVNLGYEFFAPLHEITSDSYNHQVLV